MARFKMKERVRVSENSQSPCAGCYGYVVAVKAKGFNWESQRYRVKTDDNRSATIAENMLESTKVVKPERQVWCVLNIDNADVEASDLSLAEAEKLATEWAAKSDEQFAIAKVHKVTKVKHVVLETVS
ncbi:hypothetical protein VPHD479_0071 [Vibrio phage D479]